MSEPKIQWGKEPTPEEREFIEAEVKAWSGRGLGETGAVIDALTKFQEMRESNDFCCLNILSDYDFVWGVDYDWSEFGETSKYGEAKDYEGHVRHVVGGFNSYTLDEAINEAYDAWTAGKLNEISRRVEEVEDDGE